LKAFLKPLSVCWTYKGFTGASLVILFRVPIDHFQPPWQAVYHPNRQFPTRQHPPTAWMLKSGFWRFVGRKNYRRKEEIKTFSSINMYKTEMMTEEHNMT
jgi:hypothetical protein